jgi:HlyD family secretion protein
MKKLKNGRAIKWLAIFCILVSSVAASTRWGPRLYSKYFDSKDASAKQEEIKFATATRGDLRITVVEDGKLRAIKNHAIFPQLRGQSRISFLIPEGTTVKKGDKLVEFEKKPLEELLQTKTTELEGAKREIVVKEEALTIQRSTSKAAVAAAETKRIDAKSALDVYRNLEGPKKLNELETAINDARGKLTTAQKNLGDAQKKLEDQLFVEDAQRKGIEREVTAAKDQADSLKKMVDTQVMQQKIFRRYDYPQSIRTKQAALDNSILEVEKAQVQARSEVLQKEQEFAKQKDIIARLTREIKDLTEQIEKCTLTAPLDGMVLYGDPTNPNRWYYGGETQIRVGMDWYGSNTIMTIPDLSAFEITIAIGEEYRGKLTIGCPATIKFDAIPGLTLQGKVKTISNLARPRIQWDPSSPKVFDTTLSLEKADSRMVSGMTTRVEIVAEVVPKVLMVPIEAVFNDNGVPVCYVRSGEKTERHEVKPGKSNDHMLEILSGLNDGEQVDLLPTRTAVAKK